MAKSPEQQIKQLEQRLKKLEGEVASIDRGIKNSLVPSADKHHQEMRKYIDEALAKLDKRLGALEGTSQTHTKKLLEVLGLTAKLLGIERSVTTKLKDFEKKLKKK